MSKAVRRSLETFIRAFIRAVLLTLLVVSIITLTSSDRSVIAFKFVTYTIFTMKALPASWFADTPEQTDLHIVLLKLHQKCEILRTKTY